VCVVRGNGGGGFVFYTFYFVGFPINTGSRNSYLSNFYISISRRSPPNRNNENQF
jgi:hypothetical protein